jgi:hypothetical protein
MNKKLEILLSSYIDEDCEHPEIVEDMLKQNKEAEEIYRELSTSKQIKDLKYKECTVPFDKIVLLTKKEPIKRLLVTIGAVAIAILVLLPLIRNSYQNRQLKIKNLTEVLK